MNTYLFWGLIASSIALIVLIAMQATGGGLGAAFGGGGEAYSTKRGLQKKIYYATIAVAAIFLVLAILSVLIP